MAIVQRKLSNTFKNFFESEKSSGILLIICTVVSLLLANSIMGANYLSMWQMYVGGSTDYDKALKKLVEDGAGVEAIYESPVVDDIGQAADVLLPVYEKTRGVDGFVSLEVSRVAVINGLLTGVEVHATIRS